MLTPMEVCFAVVAKFTKLGYHMSMTCHPGGYIGVSLHLFSSNSPESVILGSRYYTLPDDLAKLTKLAGLTNA